MNTILERIKKDKPEHLAKHLVEFLTRLSVDDKVIAFNCLYDRAKIGELQARLWDSVLDVHVLSFIGCNKKLQAKATQRLLRLMTGKVKPIIKTTNVHELR